jgi:hypothetical protein
MDSPPEKILPPCQFRFNFLRVLLTPSCSIKQVTFFKKARFIGLAILSLKYLSLLTIILEIYQIHQIYYLQNDSRNKQY